MAGSNSWFHKNYGIKLLGPCSVERSDLGSVADVAQRAIANKPLGRRDKLLSLANVLWLPFVSNHYITH